MPARVKKTSPKSSPRAERSERPDKRAENGQFAKGNPGGPGNPFNRQLAAFRKMLVEVATPDDVQAVGRVIIARARDGNLTAV